MRTKCRYLILFLFLLLVGCSSNTARNRQQFLAPPSPTDLAQGDNLQFKNFKVPTPAPTGNPGNPCKHDTGGQADPGCECPQYLVTCQDKQCTNFVNPNTPVYPPMSCDQVGHAWCSIPQLAPTDGTFCIGKPVIYLYPTEPTIIDVIIKTSGDIITSDPLYPTGGWQNVLAYPNGMLFYNSKWYKELFYESEVHDFRKPTAGITLQISHVRPTLSLILAQLGLNEAEATEFLDFWVPRLESLHSTYIFFSLIENDEKQRLDHVIITPTPDTMIEFIAYFKPLKSPFAGQALVLPKRPPVRKGFTAVEWGGTIDTVDTNTQDVTDQMRKLLLQ